VGNLSWLLTQSIQWARSIPLTNAPQGRYDAIALEIAARGVAATDAQADYADISRIDAARAATPFEFYQQLAEQAPLALDALKELESVVDARLGDQGPSFSAARDAVSDVVRSALRMASASGVTSLEASAPPPLPGNASAEASASPVAASTANINGEITNRREALLLLRRVADFFRRTEPHSPVAYLADKAARWGNMPLHVWLKAVVKDNAALSQLEDLLDVGADESRNG
jgi:type VI secretion system protein ImpA